MKLWCMEDAGNWGQDLAATAKAHGWGTRLFSSENLIPPDKDAYVFARVNQGTARMVMEKRLVKGLADSGQRLIIDPVQTAFYEDKLMQVQAYAEFMPKTHLLYSKTDATAAVGTLGYPFVSKSRTGSASKNVRLVHNKRQADIEIEAAFGPGGLKAGHRLGEKAQRNYLIWQEFLPGNAYDYRICKIGRARMVLRRGNRDDLPFASGSGKTEPVIELDRETKSALSFADVFFAHAGTNWCGIDVVRDTTHGCWRLLETTIGWSQKAYADCTFFGSRRKGSEMWELVCDEIMAGVFR